MRSSKIVSAYMVIAAVLLVAQRPAGHATSIGGAQTAPSGAAAAKQLPPPNPAGAATKFSKVIGWPAGRTPKAPAGFDVTLFAAGLESPRSLHVLPNGDVLVAEALTELKPEEAKAIPPALVRGFTEARNIGQSVNRITLLRGAPDMKRAVSRWVLLAQGPSAKAPDQAGHQLRQPFGMLYRDGMLYVGNTDALIVWPFTAGSTTVSGRGRRILELPASGYNNHWTRNVIASADGSRLYVSVGSGTNVDEERVDEKDPRRAAILEVKPDGTGMRVFASGLRNPVGMDLEPRTKQLWTVVNERDMLGDELVPDYLTSVREGAFYGWPYSYFGSIEDPRKKGERPDLVAKAIPPDFPLGAHTGSLGLAFYRGAAFPARYRGGAFVGQHGSWNRSTFAGYKVLYIAFTDGRPSGPGEDFLTGFIANEADEATREVYGRPVGIANLPDGSLLVADDAGNCVWRVSAVR